MTVWRLSVVVPVLDEETSLPELIRRCLAVFDELDYRCELILVDDGSRDASPRLIRDAARRHRGRVVGVILNRNYGQHAAVIAGLAEARGDVVVTIDADLQNPPEEIPKLLPHVEDGCDVVGSVRLARRDHWLRRIASSLVNRLVRRATGVMMHDYGCMLRAYRRPVVNAILRCGERSTFVPILANCFAGRTAEVEVEHAPRRDDRSKYSVAKLVNLYFDLLTSVTDFPLRLLSIAGFALALAGFLCAAGLLTFRLAHGAEWAADGVFTGLCALFVFVGGQLMGMGLLGEYIGRIYHDVRARPRYFVQERVGQVDDRPNIRPVARAAAGLRTREQR